MENRNGLAVDTHVAKATGKAEREAALSMAADIPDVHRVTIGADKGSDCKEFIDDLRCLTVTPHVAQKVRDSAIDGRTTRQAGYAVSQKKRKRVEEIFG